MDRNGSETSREAPADQDCQLSSRGGGGDRFVLILAFELVQGVANASQGLDVLLVRKQNRKSNMLGFQVASNHACHLVHHGQD